MYQVSEVFGAGFSEKVYENALMIEPMERGLKAEGQVPVRVAYKKIEVGDYYADIIVEAIF